MRVILNDGQKFIRHRKKSVFICANLSRMSRIIAETTYQLTTDYESRECIKEISHAETDYSF